MSLPIHISEWSRVPLRELSEEIRREIDNASDAWRQQNGLPTAPLSFAGPDGSQLCTRQYVGVVEVNDVVVEIYPKLDATLIEANEEEQLPPSTKIDSVMRRCMQNCSGRERTSQMHRS